MSAPDLTTPVAPRSAGRRRGWLAALLSLLIPGLGQVYAGHFQRGVVAYTALIGIDAIAFRVWTRYPSARGMWLLLVVLVGMLVIVVIDAARLARRAPVPFIPTRYNRWYVYGAAILVSVVVGPPFSVETLRTQGLEAFREASASMSPTWLPGDYLMSATMKGPPSRGEIVIMRQTNVLLIYRIEGLPGDTVAMSSGRLVVNGATPYEPYATTGAEDQTDDAFAWQRPFLAPGRNVATYSPTLHDWGPLVVPAGDYFVLGDNRDTAMDSRYRGFIPASDILKRPLFIYLSWDADHRAMRWNRIGLTPR